MPRFISQDGQHSIETDLPTEAAELHRDGYTEQVVTPPEAASTKDADEPGPDAASKPADAPEPGPAAKPASKSTK